MEQARGAGAEIVKEARETFFGGYGGYFRDPDGHLWEIVRIPRTSRPIEQHQAGG